MFLLAFLIQNIQVTRPSHISDGPEHDTNTCRREGSLETSRNTATPRSSPPKVKPLPTRPHRAVELGTHTSLQSCLLSAWSHEAQTLRLGPWRRISEGDGPRIRTPRRVGKAEIPGQLYSQVVNFRWSWKTAPHLNGYISADKSPDFASIWLPLLHMGDVRSVSRGVCDNDRW